MGLSDGKHLAIEQMDIQEQVEFRHDLAAFIGSSGWRMVVRPTLEQRCDEIKRRLANGKRLGIEEIRELQAKYSLLHEMVDDPARFFLQSE